MMDGIWHLNACPHCSKRDLHVSMQIVGDECYCKECGTYWKVSYRTKEEDK